MCIPAGVALGYVFGGYVSLLNSFYGCKFFASEENVFIINLFYLFRLETI